MKKKNLKFIRNNNLIKDMKLPKRINHSFFFNSKNNFLIINSEKVRNEKINCNIGKNFSLNNTLEKNNTIHNYVFKVNFPEIKKNFNSYLLNNKEINEDNSSNKRNKLLIKLKNPFEKRIEDEKKSLSATKIFHSRINFFLKIGFNINYNSMKNKDIKILKSKKEIIKKRNSIKLNNTNGMSLLMSKSSSNIESQKINQSKNNTNEIIESGNENINKKIFNFDNEKLKKFFQKPIVKIKQMKLTQKNKKFN